jgi:hypothetical protein
VTLTAKTNLQWWAKQGTDAPVYSYPIPTAYKTDDKVNLIIPERPTDEIDSWTSPEDITITAGYDALPGIPACPTPWQIQFTRPAYDLSVSAISPNPLPSNAGTANVTFASTADSYYVQWRDSPDESTSNLIGTAQILVNGMGVQAVAYPALSTAANRNLYLYHETTRKLLYLTPVVQKMPYYIIGYQTAGWPSNSTITNYCPSGYTALPINTENYYVDRDISDVGSLQRNGSGNITIGFGYNSYFYAIYSTGNGDYGRALEWLHVDGKTITSVADIQVSRYANATNYSAILCRRNN